jgi:hypothetical protein
MVTRASAVTISRAAEFLSKDQRTIAFALAEMEYLRELLAEHKRNLPAVLSGFQLPTIRPLGGDDDHCGMLSRKNRL